MTNRITNPGRRITSLIRIAANAVAGVLLAPSCAACGAVLDDPLAGCVCTDCWRAILPMTPPVCDRCGDPLARPDESRIVSLERQHVNTGHPIHESRQLCRHCREGHRVIGRARAVGEYDGSLREIIHALKYGGRRTLAAPIASLMRRRGAELLAAADCVVPVPLHLRREYSRGFNQARELARHLGLPVLELLRRSRWTTPQVDLPADQRHANVEGAFRLRKAWLRKRSSLSGLTVVLVDDVSTTGATLEACAATLKQADALEVYALTAARVVTSRPFSARLSKPDFEVPTHRIPNHDSRIPSDHQSSL
jgi:ComF family protein